MQRHQPPRAGIFDTMLTIGRMDNDAWDVIDRADIAELKLRELPRAARL